LADYVAEDIKRAYQGQGYFLAKASCEVISAGHDSQRAIVDLFITAHEGPQLRLSDIHWRNMTAFSKSQLLAATPIHPGEIFSGAKIVTALEGVRKLYGSFGHIHFTSIPNTEIDERDLQSILTSMKARHSVGEICASRA
jgi:outer membrane protein assembly factor BamA